MSLWQNSSGIIGVGGKPTLCASCPCNVVPSGVYACGTFSYSGFNSCRTVAKWDGSSWTEIGAASGGSNSVYAMCMYNGKLIIGGDFTSVNGVSAHNVAAWDGVAWSALAGGESTPVFNLRVFGALLLAGRAVANAPIDTWNGTTWSTFSQSGTSSGEGTFFNVIGGTLYSYDGNDHHVYQWGGSSWAQLAAFNNVSTGFAVGQSLSGGTSGSLMAPLTGVSANSAKVQRFASSVWSNIGPTASGFTPTSSIAGEFSTVRSGSVYANLDDAAGTGRVMWLYGGGTTWASLTGGTIPTAGQGYDIKVHPTSNEIYIGGTFATGHNHIAKYSGLAWVALGSGLNNDVYCIVIVP